MKSYKQWSGEERLASLRLTNKAIKDGKIPPPTKCNRCGQIEGIIHYHNHDYSDPIKFLEPLCWRCHMIHHSRYHNPQRCIDYWEQILQGKIFPPVYKHNFDLLWKDIDAEDTKKNAIKEKQNNLEKYMLQGV